MRRSAAAAVCLGMFVIPSALAFLPGSPLPARAGGVARCASTPTGVAMQAGIPESRRVFLRSAIAGGALAGALVLQPAASPAEVMFDTERYGDKELKVALINKVKQQLRALFEKRPELLVPFFRLALTDGLSYVKATGKGGMDGSVMKKMDLPENADLLPAATEVARIKKELGRQTEVSNADIIAFGGAVAMESIGSSRVVIQLGRADGKKEQPPSAMAAWDAAAPTAEGLLGAFSGAGLGAKEAVLLAGVVGALQQAALAMRVTLDNKVECDPAEDGCTSEEEGYYGLYSPVTIVSETSKEFGKNRGATAVNSNVGYDSARIAGLAGDAKFSNGFLKSAKKSADPLALALMSSEDLKKVVGDYEGNEKKFKSDAVKAYVVVTELGRSNTSR
eukprot:CAMPEP_0180144674 /NCGR_PEP_ID=MMETSP0986-20121125/17104_1 /TAXON_ID=697907 /ORGANISM="non described non described, Strain CCMP2293" /LENGTH=391 /DNA_ID=CAMNT_0022088683 /DNA_START=76 /DNA_END=1251 /DNA_ORIENTATION=-